MTKELCHCGKTAVWDYLPGFSSGDSPYLCDDCVNRGCECNHRYCFLDQYQQTPDLPEGTEGVDWKWIKKDFVWTYIDEKGREYPCSEYMWDPEGFERDINPHNYEEENK